MATAGGVIGLAGCSDANDPEGPSGDGGDGGNGDGGDGDGGDGDGGGDVGDTQSSGEFRSSCWQDPSQAHFNYYNSGQGFVEQASFTYFTPLSQIDWRSGDFIPVLATDWEVGEKRITITIDDRYSWADGTSLTAEDVVNTFRFDIYMNEPLADFVTEANAIDEETVELQLPESANPRLALQVALTNEVTIKYDVFEEYLSGFEEADNDEKIEEIRGEVAADFTPEEPFGSGPLVVDEITSDGYKLAPNEGNPYGSELNYNYFYEWVSSGQTRYQAMIEGKYDGEGPNMGAPPEVAENFPDSVETIFFNTGGGITMIYNHGLEEKYLDRRPVRQALAYAFDAAEVSRPGFHEEVKEVLPAGISSPDTWLGDRNSDYLSYDKNTEKAASLLESEGFEREDGEWYTPDGDRYSIECSMVGAWSDMVALMENLSQALEDFGISSNVTAEEVAAYTGSTMPESDFEVGAWFWGGPGPHPYYEFRNAFNGEVTNYANYSAEISLPPVGEPDGPEETVNLTELTKQLGSTADEEEEKELVRQLAWAYNYDLPQYILFTRQGRWFIDTEEWDIPDMDDPVIFSGENPHRLPATGSLHLSR